MHPSARSTLVALLLALPACGGHATSGGDGGPGADGGLPTDGATTDGKCGTPCGDACCEDDQTCAHDVCVPVQLCDDDDDCQNDSYCDESLGLCLPYGTGPTPTFDPECTRLIVVGVFAPGVQCDWTGPPAGDPWPAHANVLGTPVVADLDLDGDPAVRRPSIVFVSYDGLDGGSGACVGDATWHGVIRVIDGASCAQQLLIDTPSVIPASPLAVADLDGAPDGRPEIVAHRIGGGLVAFRYDATIGGFVTYWQTASTLGAGVCQWSGPSVHDLDDDGVPEVLMGGAVFDGTTGTSRDETLGLMYYSPGQLPVVADLLADGRPELLTGDAIYEWDAAGDAWVATATGLGARGLVALADFGTYGADPALDDRAALDGVPEIAVISTGQARLVTLAGRVLLGPTPLLFFPPAVDPGNGGPPTVADFDGDGRAEFAVAGRGGYNVFDPDCTGAAPDPATCATARNDGVLWAMGTQDLSSSVTGSSVFDFEGDGQAEVVYADECFSRVYDGRGGEILYSQFRTSCTWYENPIVADVDGDFNSEIVIPSNANCSIVCPTLDPQFDGLRCLEDAECPPATTCGFDDPGDPHGRCRCALDADCGGNGYVCRDPVAGPSAAGRVCRAGHPGTDVQGVRVIRDSLDRWVNSRPIWNQHAYAVTHVDDAGRVPRTSLWEENWAVPGLNNFRQNVVGDLDADASPDMTSRPGTEADCADGVLHLRADVCNRGTEPVAPGVPVTFYQGDPAVLAIICTVTTTTVLDPGECEPLTCDWTSPPHDDPVPVWVVADDAGQDGGSNSECHEGNNRALLGELACGIVP